MQYLTIRHITTDTGIGKRTGRTHEGSGMGKSEADLEKCCPGAVIKKGLAIQGSSVGRCDAALKQWLEA